MPDYSSPLAPDPKMPDLRGSSLSPPPEIAGKDTVPTETGKRIETRQDALSSLAGRVREIGERERKLGEARAREALRPPTPPRLIPYPRQYGMHGTEFASSILPLAIAGGILAAGILGSRSTRAFAAGAASSFSGGIRAWRQRQYAQMNQAYKAWSDQNRLLIEQFKMDKDAYKERLAAYDKASSKEEMKAIETEMRLLAASRADDKMLMALDKQKLDGARDLARVRERAVERMERAFKESTDTFEFNREFNEWLARNPDASPDRIRQKAVEIASKYPSFEEIKKQGATYLYNEWLKSPQGVASSLEDKVAKWADINNMFRAPKSGGAGTGPYVEGTTADVDLARKVFKDRGLAGQADSFESWYITKWPNVASRMGIRRIKKSGAQNASEDDQDLPLIGSQPEYDAIPPGTAFRYRDADGMIKVTVKPAAPGTPASPGVPSGEEK
jgi:hypothetical protein